MYSVNLTFKTFVFIYEQQIVIGTFLQTCLIRGPRCTDTGDSGTDAILSGDPGKRSGNGKSKSIFEGLPKGDLTGLPTGVELGLDTETLNITRKMMCTIRMSMHLNYNMETFL